MKEDYKEFIGIYDESIPPELCNDFVKNYEKAIENRTFIDVSVENETGQLEDSPPLQRKDETAFITPLLSTIYPIPPVKTYFTFLQMCYRSYAKKYSLTFGGPLYNDVFKIHKVKKSEGYHQWHCEKDKPSAVHRILAYMTYLEAPKEGGETEFLHQSLRIKPVVGRTLIWPTGFTHVHRGNPPLDGEKMYVTGWFTCGKEDGFPNP
jgi:hypothetical protein